MLLFRKHLVLAVMEETSETAVLGDCSVVGDVLLLLAAAVDTNDEADSHRCCGWRLPLDQILLASCDITSEWDLLRIM